MDYDADEGDYSANEHTIRQNKKTIMPKDVLEAITDIEFEDFLPRLEAELASKH